MQDGGARSARHLPMPWAAARYRGRDSVGPCTVPAAAVRKAGLRIAGAAVLALALAGCGLNGPHAAASGSPHDSALAFAACMRSHGLPQFPDPTAQGQFTVNAADDGGVSPSSSTFQDALQACHSLLPRGNHAGGLNSRQFALAKRRALAFSACMRAHGVPSFPDPKFSAHGISLEFPSGVNPSSPAFQEAQAACAAYAPFHGHVPGAGKGGQGSGPTVVIQ